MRFVKLQSYPSQLDLRLSWCFVEVRLGFCQYLGFNLINIIIFCQSWIVITLFPKGWDRLEANTKTVLQTWWRPGWWFSGGDGTWTLHPSFHHSSFWSSAFFSCARARVFNKQGKLKEEMKIYKMLDLSKTLKISKNNVKTSWGWADFDFDRPSKIKHHARPLFITSLNSWFRHRLTFFGYVVQGHHFLHSR